jgi:hypothetical protein
MGHAGAMKFEEIGRSRVDAQGIAAAKFAKPAEAVAWLGAMQAQDFAGAKWSMGLRMPEAVEADIDRAIAKGEDRAHVADARHAALCRGAGRALDARAADSARAGHGAQAGTRSWS